MKPNTRELCAIVAARHKEQGMTKQIRMWAALDSRGRIETETLARSRKSCCLLRYFGNEPVVRVVVSVEPAARRKKGKVKRGH